MEKNKKVYRVTIFGKIDFVFLLYSIQIGKIVETCDYY